VSPLDEPDDAVLLELGRLTWAAINLEDVIPTVRRAIGPAPKRLASEPVSVWIKDALDALGHWPESEVRETACRWFTAARQALQERNSVLHSVPVALFIRNDDGGLTMHGQALDHIPARKGKPVRRILLAEDQLRVVRQKLTEAREGRTEICEALYKESQQNAGG
jgi:hypothetical protein